MPIRSKNPVDLTVGTFVALTIIKEDHNTHSQDYHFGVEVIIRNPKTANSKITDQIKIKITYSREHQPAKLLVTCMWLFGPKGWTPLHIIHSERISDHTSSWNDVDTYIHLC